MRDIQSNIDNNDEISLMELLQILIDEKITILITFVIVVILSIAGIFYYNTHNINIQTYLRTPNKISKKDILNDEILRKIYMSGDIDTTKLSFFSYKNKFKVEELLPKKDDKTEKILPFKNYILKFNYKSREKSKKILNLYINKLKEYNIIKNSDNNLYPLLDEKILKNNDYSYNDLLTLISNKSKKIYKYLTNNKKTFSNFNSFYAQDIALKTQLDNLINIDIKDLDYYILSCNFIKSKKLWKEQYNYRFMTLTSEIKSKQVQALELKKMLNEFKLERSNNSQRNEYYLNSINKYVDLEFKIIELKSKMKQLQNVNSSFTIPDEKQTKYINGQFNLIFQRYNKIVTDLNKLQRKHNLISANNMYTIVVPPTSVPTFNMLLSFFISLLLASFVALISAFIKYFFASFYSILISLELHSFNTSFSNFIFTKKVNS